jgi:hypothetical protein
MLINTVIDRGLLSIDRNAGAPSIWAFITINYTHWKPQPQEKLNGPARRVLLAERTEYKRKDARLTTYSRLVAGRRFRRGSDATVLP